MASSLFDAGDAAVWVPGANLSLNGRKARYGVAHVRAIASQAGWHLRETSADEDTEAVDLTVDMAEGSVYVQVKCGTRQVRAGHVTVPVEKRWIQSWATKKVPVYLVYVKVASDPKSWLVHDRASTVHASIAYWARVDGLQQQRSVKVPTDARLTADTLTGWRRDFLDCFQATGVVS